MSYGLIGLGTMGSNLALNISKKHKLHLYNRSQHKVHKTIEKGKPGSMKGYQTILQMTNAMTTPRTLITMLPHGSVTTDTITHTLRLLDPGDTIIDCANEHYTLSKERLKLCDQYAVNYLGAGVSGGAKGALDGPAVMVGGRSKIYKMHESYLESFCKNVVHIKDTPDSGHFVKMVHNGIEYVMLQAIADVYAYFNYDYSFMSTILRRCHASQSLLHGYLARSAFHVLDTYDIENISDIAEMNNTGLWCVQYAYEHSLHVPTMHAAVQARIASKIPKNTNCQRKNTQVDLDAAYNSLVFVYANALYEGLALIEHAHISTKKAQDAWSKSTIIECNMIKCDKDELYRIMNENIHKTRVLYSECVRNGVPVPSISAAVQNHDFIHQQHTQMSLLMAQRNYFGQHSINNL